MKSMHARWITFWVCLLFSFSLSAAEIKMALLVPEGSTWMNLMHEWDKELQAKTAGRVKFQFYSGGAMGDERDVVRKMQIGQLHAAGLTGQGSGMILPEIRVMEIPFLFETHAQVEQARKALSQTIAQDFEKKGYVLLGWAENGFVYIFSKKPIATRADMKKQKMWAWVGDPLVAKLYEIFQITPVPLAMPDVLPSLQTHLVDAVYGPPLAVLAAQWFTAVSYVTAMPVTHATGTVLLTKKMWQTLSPEDQQVLRSTAEKYTAKLNLQITSENEAALKTLYESGLKKVEVTPEESAAIRTQASKVRSALAGELYPAVMLKTVEQIVSPKTSMAAQGR